MMNKKFSAIFFCFLSLNSFADSEYSIKEKKLDMCLQEQTCAYLVSGWFVGKGTLEVYMKDELYNTIGNDDAFLKKYYLNFLNYHNEKTLLLLSSKIGSHTNGSIYETPIFSNKTLMKNVRSTDSIDIQNFEGTESRKTLKVE